jgi:hypothetical protein
LTVPWSTATSSPLSLGPVPDQLPGVRHGGGHIVGLLVLTLAFFPFLSGHPAWMREFLKLLGTKIQL